MATTNELAPAGATTLALPADVLATLADEAKAAAAQERPAVGRISLKSGVMSYAGTPLPGNKMEAVVLCASFRNVWYAGRYDPNNIVSPNCFALSMTDENMAPHANVAEPAADTCATCENNEWGSDPNGGRGKACKQSRRLILLPGHAAEQGPGSITTAELAVLDLPVTSVRNYSSYVNTLAAATKLPPYGAICEVSVVPDAKTQFKVQFRAMRVLPSVEHVEAVRTRLEGARALAMEPYEETATAADAEAAAAAAAPAKAPGKKKY